MAITDRLKTPDRTKESNLCLVKDHTGSSQAPGILQ